MGTKHPSLLGRWWARCLVVFAIWTAVGLIDASQAYIYHVSRGDPLPVSAALLIGVADWYVWALLTPFIVWMAGRFPLEQPTAARLLLHAVASIVTSLIVIAVGVVVLRWIVPIYFHRPPRPPLDVFQMLLNLKIVLYTLTHWLILGVTHGIMYYGKYRDRELRTAQLETQLAQAQLQMLKMQLHPHFLFNTLHAISALVHKDVHLAERMIACLGELLRSTLDHAGTQEVTLREELDSIEPYVEIEKARLGPRLNVTIAVEGSALDAVVPSMILQPLVENAIRHGIAPRPGPGTIEVSARCEAGTLRLWVRDSGVGLPPRPPVDGVGLANTRARLRHLYGDRQSFDLANHPEGGAVVSILIPFREMAAGPGEDLPTADTAFLSLVGPRHEHAYQDPDRR